MKLIYKYIKRFTLFFVCILILAIVFRGSLYRSFVTYTSIGYRPIADMDKYSVKAFVDQNPINYEKVKVNEVVQHTLNLVSDHLSFTTGKCSSKPSELLKSKNANCIGYASFFVATFNTFSTKHLDQIWAANQRIGQITILGENIHRYTNSPFFKDHDSLLSKIKIRTK